MTLIPFREANPIPRPGSYKVSWSGGTFDVRAALIAGGGVFTVDDSTQASLVAALDQFSGVYRADGSTPAAHFPEAVVNTTADAQAALTAARLARGGTVRGVPGASFLLTSPFVVGSKTTFNMTGCTITFANSSVKTNMLQSYAVGPVATATDVSTGVGNSVITSPTLAAQASIGQMVGVVGAGPTGGNGGGRIWLYGKVSNVSGNTITLSGNVNGVAAAVALSGATGYLFNRDSDIKVIGGTWYGGNNWNVLADRQAAGYLGHQLLFRRVDKLVVKDLSVKLDTFTGKGWTFGVALGDVTDYVVDGVEGNNSSTAVQGDGPLARGVVKNITGSTQDDQVAFGCVGFQGNDCEGDVTGLVVDGVLCNGSWTGFKLFAGTGANGVQRVMKATAKSVKGTVQREVVNIIDYAGAGTGPIYAELDDITATPGAGFPTINNTATYGRITQDAPPYNPAESLLLLASFDPGDAAFGFQVASGFMYYAKMKAPVNVVATSLIVYVTTAGSGLVSNQCWAGIVDQDGNLWAKTGDQSATWNSLGIKTMPLAAQGGFSLNLPGGQGVSYWAVVLSNGTTNPFFAAKTTLAGFHPGFSSSSATVPGSKHRVAFNTVGSRTNLPASISGETLNDANLKSMIFAGVK